jgi:transposase
MPNIDYPQVIEEAQEELEKLERRHRYSHLFHRVKMLRLLKSEVCSSLGEAAKALGYSRRQCQRWFLTYRKEGLEGLLVSRVHERGPTEIVTQEAFEELQEAMKRGEIATIAQAHRFLLRRGVQYAHPESVGGLLRRRKVKLKTGRPRHEKADAQEQEAFKKSSPRR